MSKKISIDFNINADTSGAKQTKQAIEEVQKAAGKGMTVDASGFDGLIAKSKELRATLEDLPSLADTGKAETGLDLASFRAIDEETQKAVNSLRSLGDSAVEAMEKAAQIGDTTALRKYETELQNIKAAYDNIADGKQFEDMSEGPGKVLDDYEAALERIDKKTQELASRPSPTNRYKEEQEYWARKLEAAEKQLEEEQKLDESQKASALSAKRTADVVIAAQKRQGMSLEELRAEYERYSQALRDAQAQGDKDGMKDNVAHLRVLKTEIKAAEVALNRVPSSFDKTGKAAVKAGYMLQSMQGGIRGVIHNIPSLCMALGGGMGLAGALTLATTAGAYLFEKINEKSRKAVEEQKKRSEELAQKADDLKKKFNDSLSTKEIAEAYDKALGYTQKITDQYVSQTEELRTQLQLRIKAMEVEEGIYDYNAEADKHDVNARFYRREITKEQRDLELEEIDMKSAEWKRNQRERKQAEIVNSKRREEQRERDRAIAIQKEADEYKNDDILSPMAYKQASSDIANFEKLINEAKDRNKRNEEKLSSLRDEFRLARNEGWSTDKMESIMGLVYDAENKIKNEEEYIKKLEEDYFYTRKLVESSDNALGMLGYSTYGDEAKQSSAESYYKALNEKMKAAKEAKINASNATMARSDAEYQYEDTKLLNSAEKEKDAAKKRESDAKREADAINNSAKLLLEAAANFKEGLSEAAKKAKDGLEDARKSIMEGFSGLSSDNEQEQSMIDKAKEIAETAMKDNAFDIAEQKNVAAAINALKNRPETAINKALISQLKRVLNEFGIESLKSNKAESGFDEISKLIDELSNVKAEATREMIIGRLMELAKQQSSINSDLGRRLGKLEEAEARDNERRTSNNFSPTQRQEQPASSVVEDKIEQAAAAIPAVDLNGAKSLNGLSVLIDRFVALASQMMESQGKAIAFMAQADKRVEKLENNWRELNWQLDRIRRGV